MASASDQSIKADSFIFRELAAPVDKKKNARRRRDPKNARSINSQLSLRPNSATDLIQQEDNDSVSSAQRATILSNVHVYIDKALYNDPRIGPMATSLGATVSETLNPSITHVIHGSIWHFQQQQQQQSASGVNSNSNNNNANKQRHPRLVMQALDRGMRVVSPTWIFECYEKKQRLPEQFYPYNMDTALRLSDQQPALRHQRHHKPDRNDNVFGLPHNELASSDSDDDETDDGHEEASGQTHLEEEYDPVEGFDTAQDAISSAMSSVPASMAPVVTSSSEDMARLEMRMKRTAEIAKLKEQRKRQRQQQRQEQPENDQEVDNDEGMGQYSQLLPGKTILRPADFAGKERVDIWYGEQSFYGNHTGLEAVGRSDSTVVPTTSRRAGQQHGSKNKKKQ